MAEHEPFSVAAAQRFADRYADVSSEKSHGQNFWRDLLTIVCGIPDIQAAGVEFEPPVRTVEDGLGFIDVLMAGTFLGEMKSAGKDLDAAEQQARRYLIALDARSRPPVLIISDFRNIRIVEVLAGTSVQFTLAELPEHVHRLKSVIGDAGRAATHVEVAADLKAAELMAELWVELDKGGYGDHASAILAVRLLFLMFCDDAGVFERNQFQAYIEKSDESGAGMGYMLAELFGVLNTPKEQRRANLTPELAAFPYVNGALFGSDNLDAANFSREMRAAVIKASHYDWSTISPAVFGSLFQAARDPQTRRSLGEHYTSPTNVLKTISGLLIDLETMLTASEDSAPKLRDFLRCLSNIKVADFAVGSGNFLVVAYRRMRNLEVRARAKLAAMANNADQGSWEFDEAAAVHLRNFYGVEVDEFSSAIARVALWLTAQQANIAQEKVLGTAPDLLPLVESANIVTADALQVDWAEVLGVAPGEQADNVYIVGNPPFIGSSLQTQEQKAAQVEVWKGVKGAADLDFVTCWFLLAAKFIGEHGGQAALVSTNSVSQGTQPPVVWGELSRHGIHIDFAHRSFRWSNDAPGVAAVHTIITGFSKGKPGKKRLYDYPDIKGQPVEKLVDNINAYLLDGPDVLISSRSRPIVPGTPIMDAGGKPVDGGYLSDISAGEAARIRQADPVAAKYLRRIVGSKELIQGLERWCLWLVDASPADLRTSPELVSRIRAVREMRAASTKPSTREDAKRAHEFQEVKPIRSDFIAVPLTSSENREYIPFAYCDSTIVPNNAISVIIDAPLWLFSILNSRPFVVWAKAVSGRLESRLRLSNTVTYNNFPLPHISDDWLSRLDERAQAILDARSLYPDSTLADLYESGSMMTKLRAAHEANDKAVLALFDLKSNATDETILERMFTRYVEATDGLLAVAPKKSTRSKRG